eukprot:5107989-Ditylum_brightwellii.AAC.1
MLCGKEAEEVMTRLHHHRIMIKTHTHISESDAGFMLQQKSQEMVVFPPPPRVTMAQKVQKCVSTSKMLCMEALSAQCRDTFSPSPLVWYKKQLPLQQQWTSHVPQCKEPK